MTFDHGECEPSYGSPRWSSEFTDCALPITFDQYARCSFGCIYCFAEYQPEHVHAGSGAPRCVNLNTLQRLLVKPPDNAMGRYIKARRPLQWVGLADPFDGMERRWGIGLQALRLFREHDYPLSISTKAAWWTEDERYVSLFRAARNWNLKFSIITTDAERAAVVEKRVVSPQVRLDALERVSSWGCGGATLRLRPFIIGLSNPGHVALIEDAARRGATALSTEFLCLDTRYAGKSTQLRELREACGFDVYAFYRTQTHGAGYMRLNREVKRPFMEAMMEACARTGLRFYSSDNDFKHRSAGSCCCGLPDDPMWEYARGHFGEAVVIAAARGTVRWSDIAHDVVMPDAGRVSTILNFRSERGSLPEFSQTPAQFMHWAWNNPATPRSPATLFPGVLVPQERDADGDIVYRYVAARA